MLEYDAIRPLDPYLRAYVERIANAPVKKERVYEARSIEDAKWGELCAAVERDPSLAARVIEVITYTGLRIGDMLRLRRVDLERAVRFGIAIPLEVKGGKVRQIPPRGAVHAWTRLLAAWPPEFATLAEAVCPSGNPSPRAGGCAYRVVRDKLIEIGARVLPGSRVHLHRLRRTLAVQALRETGGDIFKVSELLGNTPQTAMKYVDERDPEVAADLQLLLQKRRQYEYTHAHHTRR
jgi:integrase